MESAGILICLLILNFSLGTIIINVSVTPFDIVAIVQLMGFNYSGRDLSHFVIFPSLFQRPSCRIIQCTESRTWCDVCLQWLNWSWCTQSLLCCPYFEVAFWSEKIRTGSLQVLSSTSACFDSWFLHRIPPIQTDGFPSLMLDVLGIQFLELPPNLHYIYEERFEWELSVFQYPLCVVSFFVSHVFPALPGLLLREIPLFIHWVIIS